MLELYFILYRIPKMMTRLARERNRSAVKWSLIGIGAWIGAEVFVAFAMGIVHGIGVTLWGWPLHWQAYSIVTYVLALVSALVSVTIMSGLLSNKTADEAFQLPPPPPDFHNSQHIE